MERAGSRAGMCELACREWQELHGSSAKVVAHNNSASRAASTMPASCTCAAPVQVHQMQLPAWNQEAPTVCV